MSIQTTLLGLSTTPRELISTGTTWAHLRGATLYDAVPFVVVNESTVQIVRIGGSSSTAQTGMPLAATGLASLSFTLIASDAVWGFTTASTANVAVMAGRQ